MWFSRICELEEFGGLLGEESAVVWGFNLHARFGCDCSVDAFGLLSNDGHDTHWHGEREDDHPSCSQSPRLSQPPTKQFALQKVAHV